jgi:hypothetical protein
MPTIASFHPLQTRPVISSHPQATVRFSSQDVTENNTDQLVRQTDHAAALDYIRTKVEDPQHKAFLTHLVENYDLARFNLPPDIDQKSSQIGYQRRPAVTYHVSKWMKNASQLKSIQSIHEDLASAPDYEPYAVVQMTGNETAHIESALDLLSSHSAGPHPTPFYIVLSRKQPLENADRKHFSVSYTAIPSVPPDFSPATERERFLVQHAVARLTKSLRTDAKYGWGIFEPHPELQAKNPFDTPDMLPKENYQFLLLTPFTSIHDKTFWHIEKPNMIDSNPETGAIQIAHFTSEYYSGSSMDIGVSNKLQLPALSQPEDKPTVVSLNCPEQSGIKRYGFPRRTQASQWTRWDAKAMAPMAIQKDQK